MKIGWFQGTVGVSEMFVGATRRGENPGQVVCLFSHGLTLQILTRSFVDAYARLVTVGHSLQPRPS